MGSKQAGQDPVKAEEQAGDSPVTIPGPDIIAYNLRREERPGGMKVRYKIKIETGRKVSSCPGCTAPSATGGCPVPPSAPTPTTGARTTPACPATTPPIPGTAPSPSAKRSWPAALARFFTERVFGPDRAAMLAAQLPATAAGRAERRDKQAAAIRRKIARLDSAETALITELETPADPADPAAQALRQRIRARFTDLYTQRTNPGNRASRARRSPRPAPARPHPAGRTAVPGRHPHPRPRRPHRTATGRLRRPSGLQPGQKPGHHPRHPHRRHPPGHQRPAHRPPRRPQHPATITTSYHTPKIMSAI